MAEGDTILRAKRRLEALVGQPLGVSAPNPRGQAAGVGRLDGLTLGRVDARGKHLLLCFGDVVLHSHLGMNGSWHVYPGGARWRRPRAGAWAVLEGEGHVAAQFGGPTLRILSTARVALDPQLSRLGPDILGADFEADRVVIAFRAADQSRLIGEIVLDQHLVAGIGNIFKNESCFAAGIDPWRPIGSLSDEQIREVLSAAREQMLAAVAGGGRKAFAVYGRRGPCIRCAGRIRSRGQGDSNRITWWCEGCQS